jgi:hypothetical protein
MKNEASKARSLKIAFVVNADLLRRLDTILGEASKPLEYTVGFSDGTNVHYGDVENVIDLPNSNEHSIISLIAATSEDGKQTAYVTLRKSDSESPSVEYTISGSQRNVVYLGAQLDDWVAATRQWYSQSSRFSAMGALWGIALLVAPLLAWAYVFQFLFPEAVRAGKSLSWIKPVFVILLYFAEFGIFKLFPRGTFATGRGVTSHEFLLWLRRGVLATLILSVIAGVIANLMTRHL